MIRERLLILLLAIYSCNNVAQNVKEPAPKVKKDFKIELAEMRKEINAIFDTSGIIYDSAFNDYQNGKTKEFILFKYSTSLTRYHNKAADLMDSINNVFVVEKASEQEYQSFIQTLNNEKVNAKVNKLRGLK